MPKDCLLTYPQPYASQPPVPIRRRRAEKCVKNGHARWISENSIVLTAQAADLEFSDAWLWKQNQALLEHRTQARNYDQINRVMRLEELHGIPFVGQPEKLLAGKKLPVA